MYVNSNHLGNVLAVITDKRTLVNGTYEPEVVSAQDYTPFGMQMVGRTYSISSTAGYRYGFNGKEDDKDVGSGIQDYGMRIYDKRLGRFLSTDPLTKSYPWYTPYQFAGNKPIIAIDLDGEEECIKIHYYSLKESSGTTQVVLIKTNDLSYAASNIWRDLKDGINADGGRFNTSNANGLYFEGFEQYSKGSYTKGGHNIAPLRGELNVYVNKDDGYKSFSYSPTVNKDRAYKAAESQYNIGQAYDLSTGSSKIGGGLTKAGLFSLAIPAVGEVVSGPLLFGGKVFSLGGDLGEIGADLANGDKNSAYGKLGFLGVGQLIDVGVNKTPDLNETAKKMAGGLFGTVTDEVKSGAFQKQKKPSADKINKENKDAVDKL